MRRGEKPAGGDRAGERMKKKALITLLVTVFLLASVSVVSAAPKFDPKEQGKIQAELERERAKAQAELERERAKIQAELEREKAKLEDRIKKAERKALTAEDKAMLKARKVEERLTVKGRNLNFDVPPVIKDGRTLIPVRAISEGLGAKVEWDAATKTITISRGDVTIKLVLGEQEMEVNGQIIVLDVPAQAISNRTFVPLRFISVALGEKVAYDDETGDIAIGEEEAAEEGEEEAEEAAEQDEQTTTSDQTTTGDQTGSDAATEGGEGETGSSETGTESDGNTAEQPTQ